MSSVSRIFKENSVVGEVGIFWIWNNQLIQNSIPWSDSTWFDIDGEQVYDFPVDHYRYWKLLQTYVTLGLRGIEYDELPRGRVIYNRTTHIFYVYGPKKNIKNKQVQSLIKSGFALFGKKVVFKTDLHY